MNLTNILEIYFKDLGYTVTTGSIRRTIDGKTTIPSIILGFPKPCLWFILPKTDGIVVACHSQVVDENGIKLQHWKPTYYPAECRPLPALPGLRLDYQDDAIGWRTVGNINHPDFLKTLREFVNRSVENGS